MLKCLVYGIRNYVDWNVKLEKKYSQSYQYDKISKILCQVIFWISKGNLKIHRKNEMHISNPNLKNPRILFSISYRGSEQNIFSSFPNLSSDYYWSRFCYHYHKWRNMNPTSELCYRAKIYFAMSRLAFFRISIYSLIR